MPTPALSDVTTDGIRVGATAFLLPAESSPDDKRYVFGYRIVIANEGQSAATLRSRYWKIIDGEGHHEEVRGEGVVGETPRLQPGQAFKYVSYCPLPTPWGTMEGEYVFERDNGEEFKVAIGRFFLTAEVTAETRDLPRHAAAAPPRPPKD